MNKIPFGAHVKVVSQPNCLAKNNPCSYCVGNTGIWSETSPNGSMLSLDGEGYLIYDKPSSSGMKCCGAPRSENLQIICKLNRDSGIEKQRSGE